MSTRRKPNSRNPAMGGNRLRLNPLQRRAANFPTAPRGEHLWAIVGIWKVDPFGIDVVLGVDNLLSAAPVACCVCAQNYSPHTALAECPGPPDPPPQP